MTDRVPAVTIHRYDPKPTRRFRVLLVDDQPMIGEAVRRMLAPEIDVDFMYCGKATKAIAMAMEFQPTVILQDLAMPEIDGLTMLRSYRANQAIREIPIIVLSMKEEPKVKAEAFMLGANDYLVKLPDPIELTARIRHHSQGYLAQIGLNEAYTALKRSEERLAEELSQAGKYVTSLLPERLSGEIKTDWVFIPSVELGGDAFGYQWLDPDHLAMYLLDVSGHGFKAALLSISAINVLRNQTLPSTDFRSPSEVLAGLNKVFQMDRHDGMYFTMWYGVFDKQRRRLTYASGGHPPAILMAGNTEDTAELIKLWQPGMLIGAFPEIQFEAEVRDLPKFSRLYIFSDGVYEVTRTDKDMMTYEEFVEVLKDAKRSAVSVLEDTIAAIRTVHGGEPFEDDVSMMEIRF